MSCVRGSLLVVALWSAIYLTRLGTLEIKGEEGRRILPAVTMLRSGNLIVPYVGSDPYFNKPPLVNWLVAGSFQLFGVRNEWAARLPSALCVLAVAIAFVTVARRALGPTGSVIGALVWLTNFGMIEKGRLIEIEALYTSLCGLAVICWLSWWHDGRSKWLTWFVPWLFLGLCLLAKGPLHLLFFYAVVVGVLYQAGELRKLLNSAHLLGVVLMLGIFAAWAVPCLQMMREGNVTGVWTRQFSGRLSGEDFKLGGWLLNIPRGIGYFLPWAAVFVLAMRGDGKSKHRTSNIEHRTPNAAAGPTSMFDVRCSVFDVSHGLLWGIIVSFLFVSLLPGSLARYTMPLLAPASWLMAVILTDRRFQLPGWLTPRRPAALAPELRFPVVVAVAACVVIALYALAVMPRLRGREKVRNIAAQINAAIPAGETLYAIDPEYQPSLFYVRDPIIYAPGLTSVPGDARFILVQNKTEAEAANSRQWAPRQARPILKTKDYRKKELALLEVN
ncbi:MAG: glycosyltransferase family 39 protein [Chthoniobacterales bacterium]|nr:glycosyltransferase family 39 protein [Chthoniobacterales bacterium]